jgi:SNF2 family DNA or RNA helicase
MLEVNIFEDLFTPDERGRGQSYFEQNTVKVKKMIPFTFGNFEVRGPNTNEVVNLQFNKADDRIKWECTCTHFKKQNKCEHIWAVLLQAEKNGFFSYAGQNSKSLVPLQNSVANKHLAIMEKELPELQTVPQKNKNKSLIFILDLKALIKNQAWQLKVLIRDHYTDGTVGSLGYESISLAELGKFKLAADREILKAIFKLDSFYYSSFLTKDISLDSDDAIPILKIVTKYNKLFYHKTEGALQSLAFDINSAQNPLQLNLFIKKSGPNFEILARLIAGQKEIEMSANLFHLNPFVLLENKIYHSELKSMDYLLQQFKEQTKIIVTASELADFLNTIYSQEEIPKISFPPNFNYKTKKGPNKVRLTIDKGITEKELSAQLEFQYGTHYIAFGEVQHHFLDHDEKIIFERDLELEIALRKTLFAILGKFRLLAKNLFIFKENKLLEIVAKVFNLNWEVVAFKKSVSQNRDYKIKVSSGIDWFDLTMEMKFANGQIITLPDLLRNLKSGRKMITLADGTLGILNDEVIKKFSHLGYGAQIVNEKVRLSKVQALYFTSTLTEDKSFKPDRKFQTFRKLSQLHHHPKSSEPDPQFMGKLRAYQKKGLWWLETMSANEIGCLLADDMGLGKTICILALLAKHLKKQALIIVPKSLIQNWKDEAAKFIPHLKVHTHFGGARHDLKLNFSKADIVITTYHTLRNDIEFFKNKYFEYLIVDEAQFIKNADTDIHRAARLVAAEKKIGLTGTPIENSLGDLFSILNVITPGLITKDGWEKHADADDPSILKNIGKAISPFLLRRKKEEVLKDLPKKTEQVIYCELTPSERRDYNHLKKYLWASLKGQIAENGINKSRINIFTALLRLRQAACHQGLLQSKKTKTLSSKFQVLIEHLETIFSEGHKVLIFSSFVEVLTLLKNEFNSRKINYEYMDGKSNNRMALVNRFQNDKTKQVFLTTLKTGGVGLNLTAANYVFILDPWWNPATESQAIDRAHRIGQKNKVTAYKLIAKDTIEEKVLALQAKKKSISDAIMTKGGVLKGITEADLELLFA